jgi:AP2 domain
MFDIEAAKKLVREGWPITVEKYDSGQIGFVARPTFNGRRFNRTFSTAKYGTLEEAANASIRFCEETERQHRSSSFTVRSPIPARALALYEALHQEATKYGIDPVEAFQDGLRGKLKKNMKERTLSQAVESFLISLKNDGLKDGYIDDLKGFYSAFEEEFGGLKMADITQRNVDDWLSRRMNKKLIKSPLTWNEWRNRFVRLWQFALSPENGWVAENVIDEIPKR